MGNSGRKFTLLGLNSKKKTCNDDRIKVLNMQQNAYLPIYEQVNL